MGIKFGARVICVLLHTLNAHGDHTQSRQIVWISIVMPTKYRPMEILNERKETKTTTNCETDDDEDELQNKKIESKSEQSKWQKRVTNIFTAVEKSFLYIYMYTVKL